MAQGKRNSKSAKTPAKITLLRDKHDDRTSRLAVLFTEAGSEFVYMSRATIKKDLRCDDKELTYSIWVLTHKWKLFHWDDKERCYRKTYQQGEVDRKRNWAEVKSKEFGIELFKLRVQRTIHKRVALRWVLADLVKDGVTVPHSRADFAAQIATTESMISRYMNGYTTPSGVKVPGLMEVMNLTVYNNGTRAEKRTYYQNQNGPRQVQNEAEQEESDAPYEDVAHDLRPMRPR